MFILNYNYNTMKITFHAEIVNKPFEDPVLFVRVAHSKRAMLFDLGSIESLEVGKINDVTEIFVTHMHIDHFIGFDTALRILLKRDIPLSLIH
ncbi:MAG: MBL fold metallo-hydrolase, partial [Thermodesulfovibrionales bacterium]|nr:MBL fold metallo-hydrolase [Thermodesulfovibrionales bacterium]